MTAGPEAFGPNTAFAVTRRTSAADTERRADNN